MRDLAQISDAVTRDAERALVALDRDRNRVRTIERELERKRDELERERQELEQELRAARTVAERRVVGQKAQQALDRLPQVNQELQQIMADLSALSSRVTAVGGAISTFLIVPYSSPNGYCSCYDDKRNRLAALAGQRAQQMANLAPLLRQRGALAAQILPLFSAIPNPPGIPAATAPAVIDENAWWAETTTPELPAPEND
ncbi:MAG: hypothetical protein ACT4PY_05350 [Armatimonadota bacterium]